MWQVVNSMEVSEAVFAGLQSQPAEQPEFIPEKGSVDDRKSG